MDLELLRDRRVAIAAAVVVLALLAGLGIGVAWIARGHRSPSSGPNPPGSLRVEMGKEDPGLEPSRPLRCFVGGRFAGMATFSDCARRNGVAPGALDVGLDPTGAVAATGPDAPVLQPLPGAPEPPPDGTGVDPETISEGALAASGGPSAACWRFDGGWRKLADEMTLAVCVQALFAGRCERPGAADYGRWNGQTLRLVTGRVELAGDNRTFRPLAMQAPGNCAIPSVQE